MQKKLQVFISSTYLDMKEERQAVVEAVLKAKHIPAGMELFTSGDKTQWEVIKRWISESDVFILVLGGRYGSPNPENNLSYIECEYDHAVELGKPYFSIVITKEALDNKVRGPLASNAMEQDNTEKLNAFKEKVTSKMVEFYADTKDIKIAVANRLTEIMTEYPELPGWVSGKNAASQEMLMKYTQTLIENERLKSELSSNSKQDLFLKDFNKVDFRFKVNYSVNNEDKVYEYSIDSFLVFTVIAKVMLSNIVREDAIKQELLQTMMTYIKNENKALPDNFTIDNESFNLCFLKLNLLLSSREIINWETITTESKQSESLSRLGLVKYQHVRIWHLTTLGNKIIAQVLLEDIKQSNTPTT